LLGELSDTGWWYYYPAALAFKTPLPFLLLAGCGLLTCGCRRRSTPFASPLLFAAGIVLTASFSQINIGLRHVLPVYCGLALLAGTGTTRLLGGNKQLA
jgi:hypothetical protein